MNKVTIISLMLIASTSFAQTKKGRIQPGRMYRAGETLYAPRYGFTAKVPDGWEGNLPRESEVFLLTTITATYGEVYVFGRDRGELNAMRASWLTGVDLSETIKLKAGNPVISGDVLSSEVIAEGKYINKGMRGFAISRCNPNGPCVTTLMIAPLQYYEDVKKMVTAFMTAASFDTPSTASPYADFDWKEFLSGKVLATYQSIDGGSKESRIHLCGDGSFTADIRKTGFLKNQNPGFKGRFTGSWEVSGPGESTAIRFTFEKKDLPPFEAPLIMKDEKIFSDEERYFAGKSDKCK
ncbi:hypothetical protein QQ054_22215 [Oscillatoria amoena NRMC-F 0135]|nr:hypothetical protein [Oscillatoria amoena NRMC-F 0135]